MISFEIYYIFENKREEAAATASSQMDERSVILMTITELNNAIAGFNRALQEIHRISLADYCRRTGRSLSEIEKLPRVDLTKR